MAKLETKVMIIGLDAPIAPRLYNFAKEGKLPHIGRLIDNGVFAENCMVPFPTITPPNWTTIVTGSWLGTHGITCFNVHIPGDPLDKTHPGFDTSECQSEYLWNAAERAGKKSIILNYPSSWPSTLKDGIQIGGAGLSLNEWRTPDVTTGYACTLADDQLFSIEEYPQGTTIELQPASGWENAPDAANLLEAASPTLKCGMKLLYRRAKYPVQEKSWQMLVVDSKGDGYDKVILSESKDAQTAFATLSVGQWSEVVTQEFNTEEGKKEAAFKCKLIELSKDAQQLKLYVTGLCALDGWSHPESVAAEIKSKDGLPLPHGAFAALNLEWVDPQTFLEVVDCQHIWYADAASYLMKNKEWDLYFMHAHCPDWSYHAFSNKIDPATAKGEDEWKLYQDVELKFYQSLDRMIGRILEAAGDEPLVVITSDHGAKATTRRINVGQILEKAGFMVTIEEGAPGRRQVDWSKTKAVPQRSSYIYVNLKGRDPHGIVEPSEYEQVRDEIIKALYEYTDPETGKKPIALALKREDARIIGLYGDMIGDIVYALTPDFGGQHGNLLPTAQYGVGDLRGLFIMSGPGVKKDCVLQRTVWLTDIVPTVCYLTELPVPKNAEGAVIYQALEDPDLKLKELQQLRKNYERLKNAFEKEQQLTHTYNE